MTLRTIALPLTAAALSVLSTHALAQRIEGPAAKHDAVGKKASVKKPPRHVAEPAAAARPSLLGPDGSDTPLERRRKAFFSAQPDGGGTSADPSSPSAGITLGGSGGISPGMGFQF